MSVHLKHLGWIIETWGQAWKRLMSIFTWAAGSAPWWSGFPEREPDRLSVNLSSRLHRFQLVSICCCFPCFLLSQTHTQNDLSLFRCARVSEGNPCVLCQTRACFSPARLLARPRYSRERDVCGYHGSPDMRRKHNDSLCETHTTFL